VSGRNKQQEHKTLIASNVTSPQPPVPQSVGLDEGSYLFPPVNTRGYAHDDTGVGETENDVAAIRRLKRRKKKEQVATSYYCCHSSCSTILG
jgi:hypothetical protein